MTTVFEQFYSINFEEICNLCRSLIELLWFTANWRSSSKRQISLHIHSCDYSWCPCLFENFLASTLAHCVRTQKKRTFSESSFLNIKHFMRTFTLICDRTGAHLTFLVGSRPRSIAVRIFERCVVFSCNFYDAFIQILDHWIRVLEPSRSVIGFFGPIDDLLRILYQPLRHVISTSSWKPFLEESFWEYRFYQVKDLISFIFLLR